MVRSFKPLMAFISCLLLITLIFDFNTTGALNYSSNTDLSTIRISFKGEETEIYPHMIVSNAGDVNGDGYNDILIGSPFNSQNGLEAGKVYLIFGKPSGWTANINLSTAAASFIGEAAGDTAGFSVKGVGDVNGDGYDDILIGAPRFYEDGPGKVYLIFGKPTGWKQSTSLSTANSIFIEEPGQYRTGSSISGAGDVNGDGFGDFLISAESGNSGPVKTYLIFGGSSGWENNISLSKANASILGDENGIDAIFSVAGAGDVNRDGYDDFLIGTAESINGGVMGWGGGKCFLFFGKAKGWHSNMSISKADVAFSDNQDSGSGSIVAGVEDVNNDGYDDILIGAPAWSDSMSTTPAGQAFLFFGKASNWPKNISFSKADATFNGEMNGSDTGESVTGAGDVDGDGFNDLLIGAPSYGGMKEIGKTYLILGKKFNWINNSSLSSADASFIGENNYDESGLSVGGAGDVNGDGIDEVLISSPGYANNIGKIYLISMGSNSVPTKIDSIKIYTDENCSNPARYVLSGQELYVELKGFDGNKTRNDTALVRIVNSFSNPVGFNLKLRETGNNTGIYRGNFTIKDHTRETMKWIGATDGETIKVSSIQDPMKNASVLVGLALLPKVNPIYIDEDVSLSLNFHTIGPEPTIWNAVTSDNWLKWDDLTHNLSGTPHNSNVGNNWVNITVSVDEFATRNHNYTVIVRNNPPDIITKDVTEVLEDQQYLVDYNSTDDGQGNITWSVETNASDWLKIDSKTGILKGTPSNDQVGQYHVKVRVDDGNGGFDSHEFMITVIDNNDIPKITTTDVTRVLADSKYYVQYNVTDIDLIPETFTWSLSTNATWLGLDSTSGILSGEPTNDNEGWYRVNITVNDGRGGSYSHMFNLTVLHVNHPPIITSVPFLIAKVDNTYVYSLNASDVDKQDLLTYSIQKGPLGMGINQTSGIVIWKPLQGQEGKCDIVLMVSDSTVTINQSFTILVEPHLIVNIFYPTAGLKFYDRFNASGTAQGPSQMKIEIQIDDGEWSVATGNRSWVLSIDTKGLTLGNHTLKVKSILGQYQSDIAVGNFIVVRKPLKKRTVVQQGPLWILLIILILIMIIILNEWKRGKKIRND